MNLRLDLGGEEAKVAIFGRIQDLGLAEILSFVAFRPGRLTLRRGDDALSLVLIGGRVRCAFLGLEPLDAAGLVFYLAGFREGEFDFLPGDGEEACPRILELPVERLILELTKLEDELEHHREKLPHPDVSFRLSRPVASAPRVPFLQQATRLLERGVTARELAEKLRLLLDEARFLLYRLRLMGLIEEVRFTRRVSEKGVLARLLRALAGGG